MRALVLASAHDSTAAALADALRALPATSVRWADMPTLGRAGWTHAIGAQGQVQTSIDFGAGPEADFDVVINRMESTLLLPFHGWQDVDRDYGRTEWLALCLSWLHSMGGRVINQPGAGCLQGPCGGGWQWLARASQAGLPLHAVAATSSTRSFAPPRAAVAHLLLQPGWQGGDPSVPGAAGLDRAWGHAQPAAEEREVVVVGRRVFGWSDSEQAHAATDGDGEGDAEAASAATWPAACLRLARAAGVDVLTLRLARALVTADAADAANAANAATTAVTASAAALADAPGWGFVSADTMPCISPGAPLAAFVALVQERAAP